MHNEYLELFSLYCIWNVETQTLMEILYIHEKGKLPVI